MAPLVMTIMQGPLCGTLATMFLYGVICMQAFYYLQNYAKDRRSIKVLVWGIWILETAHTALSVHFVEYYLILNFTDMTTLEYAVWSMGTAYFVGFFIAYAVNLCFIWRIWLLSKKLWIAICLSILATVRLGFGLGNASIGFHYTAWVVFRAHVFATMVVGWVLSALVDITIACTLCYYLHRRRTGMRRTDSIINRLLLYSINTGAVTSFFAVLVVVTFLTLPGAAYAAFVGVQSKLYAVSLLATLNGRKTTVKKSRMAVPTVDNVALSFIPSSPKVGQSMSSYHKALPPIEIQRNTVTDVHHDESTLQSSEFAGEEPFGMV
ncbi:hypothetical protein BV22DRAFT_1028967 [Leucogyrophana mollusca]|uniref:Uncharacterized protein n=1 Tax=Leucogyrophana mollusca TaxID=85980 RepID=A0ACB8BVQ4_9AGAM|nr:hypothetical protein BV22DRAFT_1028967 [Leucogyrophana mollusca]